MQVKDLQLKRVLHTALFVLLLGAAGMTKGYATEYATDVLIGDLIYTVINSTNTGLAYVKSHKDDTNAVGSLTIPSSVSYTSYEYDYVTGQYVYVTRTYTVVAILGGAFSGCSGLTGDLTIPNSVTSIGNGAFSYCSGFDGSLTIPNSVRSIGNYAFRNCSGLTGSLTIGNSVTSIGENAFYGCSGLDGSLTIPNSVTSIGEYAFYNCSGLTGSLTIGNSVTSIGNRAFSGCGGLTGTLTIPNSVTSIGNYAFSGCSGFDGSLTISNSVTSIGQYAFQNCSGLTGSLAMPNSVTSIGEYAFYNCSGLTGSLTIPNSVTSIENSAFRNCSGFDGSLTIPNSVTSIGISTFSGCSGLTGSLTIPNSVASIGNYAFSGCSGFDGSLTIPNSVTSIGQYAFQNCSGLTGSLTIPNSVTSIGNYAFSGCSGFDGTLTIPNSVTSIGVSSFSGCCGLTCLTIPNSVTSIKDFAFSGCSGLTTVNWNAVNVTSYPTSTYYHPFKNCTNLTTVVFGDQVQRIPDYAFYNCSGLTGSLTIGNSVTSIGKYAFQNCSGLTGSLVIPNSVTSIGISTFSGCSGLTGSLAIPNSVTSIGSSAFSGCSGLTTVNWDAVNVSSYPSSSAFGNCPNLTTVVFGGLVQTIPAYAFYGCSGLTDLTIGNSVTSIGSYAFSNCSGLTTVNWDAVNVTSYGSSVFYNCSTLTTVVFGGQVQTIPAFAFSGCSGLTDLTIGNSVTSIGNSAFYGCSGLTSLTIPNSVTFIGNYAFSGCSGLTGSLTIPNSVTSIGNSAFFYCSGLNDLTIGNSVTSIGDDAFRYCSGLTALTIGNSVTSIGKEAFENCSGLTTAHWNAVNVTRYPSDTYYHPFKDCPNLTTVVFGDQVQTIPDYAFRYCSGLTALTIGNSVTSIGKEAFENCNGLEAVHYTGDIAQWCNIEYSIYAWGYRNPLGYAHNLYIDDELVTDLVIPESVTEIKNYTFEGCTCLSSLTLPNTVTTIGGYAFSGCSGLEAVYYTGDIAQWCNIEFTSISSNPLYWAHNLYVDDELVTDLVIPESVTEIKNHAFYGCSCLTSLSIPNSVASIGSSAFYGCSGLTGTLNIGNSVTSIGDYAFYNCTGINAIRLQCPAPPTIYQNSFNGVDKSIPVFVACGTQEAYLAADYWPEFTTINESPYDLIITQNDPYGGEVSVVHYADCDDNHCAILAINNIGYNFIGWFVNDYFSTDSPYCDFSLIDNVTFEARFERKPNHFITIVTSTSNTWSDPDTWDTGEVPSSTSTVGIYKDIIVDVNAEVEQMGIYDDGTITISPDVALTVTDTLGSDNVASIVIEDGGQLIHSSDEAMATVKKSIEPYTTNADGWNLISFPLTGNGTVASIGNMLDNQYDLYAYDEPTQYWINQKEESNGFTALESGQGYLYANKGTGMGLAAGSKIGEGTSTIGYTPFYTYYEYTIAENLFLASELEAAGLPTTALGGLCWYATNQTSYLQSNISIWMANVNDEALTTTSHNVSNMTLVYTGDMTPVVGWNSFVFNENNFTWDGTSNVLVCVQRNNGTYNSTVYWQAHNPGFAATSYKYNTSSAYDMTSGTYSMNVSSSLRLNTVFQTLEQVGQFEYYEPITMSFAGEMENGSATVTVPLSYTETAGNLKGFNLVGNPFVHNVTSYGSTNVADGCFRLNETKDNLIVSEVSETQPLKPAEGFFVKATAEGASITFNPGRSRSENERKGFVNLELRENGKLIDRLIVKREGEPLEKLMLKGNGTRLYALQDRQEIAIVPCEGDEQAVCFKADENGSYTINVSVNGFELDYLYLIDNLTGNDVNLLVEPSYSFEAKTTDYASRFKLVFATGSSEDPEGDSFAFFNSSGNLTIYGVDDEVTLQVVDVLGHVLSTERFSGSYEKKLNVAPGVYMLRLINGDDVKVQKIIIKN